MKRFNIEQRDAMKTCPKCGSRYTDDTLSFCLSDGSRLSAEGAESEVTILIGGETDTVERQVARGPVADIAPIRPEESRTGRTLLAVLLTAVGMLVLFGIVAIAGFFVWRNLDRAPENNTVEKRNTTTPTPTPMPTTPPTPKPTATAKATPQPTVDKTPDQRSKYPSTTRLTMGKGTFSTSFSGEVNAGESRTFVLACRSGQSLSATVNGGPCVSFSGGGSSLSRTTSAGDNSVTVTNTCSETARFSLRISVI